MIHNHVIIMIIVSNAEYKKKINDNVGCSKDFLLHIISKKWAFVLKNGEIKTFELIFRRVLVK